MSDGECSKACKCNLVKTHVRFDSVLAPRAIDEGLPIMDPRPEVGPLPVIPRVPPRAVAVGGVP